MTTNRPPLPGWATPGTEVIIREPYNFGGGAQHTRTKITRVTTTSIFVEGYKGERRFVMPKYFRELPEEYGNAYRHTLYPLDHSTIQTDKSVEETRAALARARAAIGSWHHDPTDPERTAEAITALQDYHTHQQKES